jgi:crotonobetainyl-CoA:carnitine CoA-transferase CaiB-like acyl-CoA transferase
MQALKGLRICDFTGQLAGAGATRTLAAFGAQIIRIEDPSNEGRWDILRGNPPFADERRGREFGGAFNNHNVEKLGITLDLRRPGALDVLGRLVAVSDVVTENFAAGVLARRGVTYEWMRSIRPDIIFLSNSGFGQTGPYSTFKCWGPIAQAVSGLTYTARKSGSSSAGWGFSYMDHQGANFMTFAVLAALRHRARTGRGQWIDMATTEVAAYLLGSLLLDYNVNGRRLRDDSAWDSNRGSSPVMAPHGIYPAAGDDEWIAIACRDDKEWLALAACIDEAWARDTRYAEVDGRVDHQDALDRHLADWTKSKDKFQLATQLHACGVPAAAVQRPGERVDQDPNTQDWGLWPSVIHPSIGEVRVDGLPIHLSETDWAIRQGAPLLGEHNRLVYCDLLGYTDDEFEALEDMGIV